MVAQMRKCGFYMLDNIMAKGENAGYIVLFRKIYFAIEVENILVRIHQPFIRAFFVLLSRFFYI